MASIFSNNLNNQTTSGLYGGSLFGNAFNGFGSTGSGFANTGSFGSGGLFGGNYGGSFFNGFGGTFGSWGNWSGWGFGNNGTNTGNTGGTNRNAPTTPTGTTIATKQVAEDTTDSSPLTFATNDFAYANGDAVAKLQVTALPSDGTLELNGSPVALNQIVEVGAFDDLTYFPDPDFDGTDTISVRLSSDGTTFDSSNSNVVISVLGENDAPSIDNVSLISVMEGKTDSSVGSALTSAFSDVDTGDELGSVTITSISSFNFGELTYQSDLGSTIAVTSSSFLALELSPAEAASLVFNASTESVASGSPQSITIGFDVTDSAGETNALADRGSLTIQVTDGNDKPDFSETERTYNTTENSTDITGMNSNEATDEESNSLLTYSISGVDSDFFSVNSANGYITFKEAPDFEDHEDSDIDGTYELTLTAKDPDGGSATQDVKVIVGNETHTLNLMSLAAAITVDEGQSSVTTVEAGTSDESNSISYSISGTDADLFSIDESSGDLRFLGTSDAENPDDDNADNQYSLTVVVTDLDESPTASATKPVVITVDDIADESAEFISAAAPTTSAPTVNVYSLVSTSEGNIEVSLVEGHTTSSAEELVVLSFSNGESSLTGDLGLTPGLTFDIESSAGTSNFTLATPSTTSNIASVSVLYSSTSADTLDHELEDEITLTVTASDTDGSSAQTDVVITILDDNEAPEYQAPGRTAVALDGTVSIGDAIFNSMIDPEDDELSFRITGETTDPTSGGPDGVIEFDWSGSGNFLSYTPGPSGIYLTESEVRSLRFVQTVSDEKTGIFSLKYEAIDLDGSNTLSAPGTIDILVY